MVADLDRYVSQRAAMDRLGLVGKNAGTLIGSLPRLTVCVFDDSPEPRTVRWIGRAGTSGVRYHLGDVMEAAPQVLQEVS